MRILNLSLLLLLALPASPVGTNVTYQFTGRCTDCTGNGTGQLVLQNYTLGSVITSSNFVSLTYSSNLLNFTLLPSDSPFIAGSLPATLPGAANVTFSGLGAKVLNTNANGTWCSGTSCLSDFGTSGTWGAVAAPPTTVTGVPALADSMLVCLAIGVAALGMRRLVRA